jgi:hypothetical protein
VNYVQKSIFLLNCVLSATNGTSHGKGPGALAFDFCLFCLSLFGHVIALDSFKSTVAAPTQ